MKESTKKKMQRQRQPQKEDIMYKVPGRPLPQLSESNRRIVDNNAPTRRRYQVWKGSNKFFLGGWLIFGPDVRSIFLTISLIVTPVIMFCAFVSHDLIKQFNQQVGSVLVSICVVLTSIVLLLLLITSGRDPGIIPRNLHPPDAEDEGSTASTDWMGSQAGSVVAPTKDIIVNGLVVKVKYCQTCMLYRPPRCSHCSICNNCVERFDHHCPWVGQCIGKRNYRFFFMFVSTTTVLCLYVFAFCWVTLVKISISHNCTVWRAFVKSPASGILIVYTFITVWFVGGLTAFHLYLILTNQTTYENFRYRYRRKLNPYNRGCSENFSEVFFSKIPPSKNNFREMVKVDSSSFCASPLSFGQVTPNGPKRSIDLEMGKRHAVAAEDLEEIQSQLDGVGGLERCGTQARHATMDQKVNWDNSSDLHVLAAEFGMESRLSNGKKSHEVSEVDLGPKQ